MKFISKNKFFLFAAMLFTAFAFSSCDDDDNKGGNEGGEDEDGYGYNFTSSINTYVDDVVISTYTDMKDAATVLYDAVDTYQDEQTPANLNAVCAAWRAMRIPWEQSEGFLFGPAALLSLDPSLDSWPLDKGGIDKIILGSESIDMERITNNNLHGFHAVEYLIFNDGAPKTTALKAREVDYLVAATEYLRNDTYQLWANWVGEDNLTDEVAEVLEEAEIEVMYNFSYQFRNAGNAGSTFLSQSDAIDQIIDGCVDIVTEVNSQKMGGPYGTAKTNYAQAVLEVESWYSWNSLDDYKNNIVSIRNSYFGGQGKTGDNASANSISAFVKSKNADLDSRVTNAIEAAYNAINAVGENGTVPFRNAIQGGSNPKIDAAMDACEKLERTLEEIKALRN